ncbi:MAG: HAMP domain-containing sensor histidine kinase [Campylobacterota bacterium]|nr:HAMP domain-containing sensor histidine kinase [Campylobacterota bacterium]
MKSENMTLLEQLDKMIDSETMDETEAKALLKQSRKRIRRFDTILKQSDKQLSEQVHQLEEEFELRVHSERILAQQAKHAAMGEMMDAVAHQWKQPLNAISMLTDLLLIEYQEGEVDEVYLENYKKILWEQIDHLLSTLAEFRSFFRPDKEKTRFSIRHAIDSVLLLIKDEFLKEMISFDIQGDNRLDLYGVENEFKHIILNIVNNARDAFKENDIPSRKISFNTYQKDNILIMEICDNAGGIPSSVIDTIFKANVTTKAEGKGTGIGLYMSAQIAEKMSASLTVANRDNGACFSFISPIIKEETV